MGSAGYGMGHTVPNLPSHQQLRGLFLNCEQVFQRSDSAFNFSICLGKFWTTCGSFESPLFGKV